MKETMNKKEFAALVSQYVKESLPYEMADAKIRIACLDLWSDKTRMTLLIIRPWNNVTTGFCLDASYYNYTIGTATAESTAASIINDRRLYKMPADNDLLNAAIIYTSH